MWSQTAPAALVPQVGTAQLHISDKSTFGEVWGAQHSLRNGVCFEHRGPSAAGIDSSVRWNGDTVHDAHRAAFALHVNPTTGEHAYYDVTNDVFLSADEATAALAMH